VDLAAMVFGLPTALFPELAQRSYDGPAGGGLGLGLMYAAYPVGVFLTGLMSGTFTRARRHGATMASAAMAWGVTLVLVGLAPRLWIALVALGLGGAANLLLSSFRNAITQAHADDALSGRTQGSLTIVLVGGPQAGNVLHGIAGSALGPKTAICLGGLLTVISVAALAWATPSLWQYSTGGSAGNQASASSAP
jgi:MFS family permease